MFKKVLVVEDSEGMNIGVSSVLGQLGVGEMIYTQYCDEAFLKAKRAALDGEPFDLLVSDLSFQTDHRNEKLRSGQELIQALRKEQPNLKTIVFSVEDHPRVVRELWEQQQAEGYVCKGRKGLTELKEAVGEVRNGKKYLSPKLASVLNSKNLVTIQDYDIQLLTRLTNGLTQDEIEQEFKKEGIHPSSKSSIEKRLKELKEEFNANTTIHLVTILKDLRLL